MEEFPIPDCRMCPLFKDLCIMGHRKLLEDIWVDTAAIQIDLIYDNETRRH
jgi:hypothetical protein